MFRGVYRGRRAHPGAAFVHCPHAKGALILPLPRSADDYDAVLQRAWDVGVERIMITAGRLQEVHEALALAAKDHRLVTTAGCHPTRSIEMASPPSDATEWDRALGPNDSGRPSRYIEALAALIEANPGKIVAVGECGLDYDRLHFSPKDAQLRSFEAQFALAERTRLPMFLHDRNTGPDFVGAHPWRI